MLHEGWQRAFDEDPTRIKTAWLSFLGHNKRYPREVMIPSTFIQGGRKRWFVKNAVELVDALADNAPKTDVWISQRAEGQFYEEDPVHTHLWIDVDAKGDLELARLRAEAASLWCEDVFGVRPYAQFSGSKGLHLHFDHEPVRAHPEQVREAVKVLLRDAGLDPVGDVDLNVVGKTRAMPRPPYAMNTNGVQLYGEVLFTVPVTVDMSVDEILEASRTVRVADVTIPYSRCAAGVLKEVIEELPAPSRVRVGTSNGNRLAKDVSTFLGQAAPFVKDGRKRYLRHLAVPAYLRLYGELGAVEACQRWVEKTGAPWSQYRAYVQGQIRAAKLHDGSILNPMRVRKFLVLNPDAIPRVVSATSTTDKT